MISELGFIFSFIFGIAFFSGTTKCIIDIPKDQVGNQFCLVASLFAAIICFVVSLWFVGVITN